MARLLSTLALSTPCGKVAAQTELRVAPPPEAATDVQGGTAWQAIRCGSSRRGSPGPA